MLLLYIKGDIIDYYLLKIRGEEFFSFALKAFKITNLLFYIDNLHNFIITVAKLKHRMQVACLQCRCNCVVSGAEVGGGLLMQGVQGVSKSAAVQTAELPLSTDYPHVLGSVVGQALGWFTMLHYILSLISRLSATLATILYKCNNGTSWLNIT